MWIELEDKSHYMDSLRRGLRLRFYSGVDLALKEQCKKFCKWLRKNYWFPIRCIVSFKKGLYFKGKSKDDKDSDADFYYSKDNEKILPEIWIATGKVMRCKPEKKQEEIHNLLFNLAHEITHYYQWYFYEFEKRTDRSLEIESNRWAFYLVEEFLKLR